MTSQTASDLYPLEFDRFLSPRLWGGERLVSFLGLSEPEGDEPLGESWQIYGGNRVLSGAHQGKTLDEVSAEWGADLIGTVAADRYGDAFPLLAKFIDAADKLSIQVHPDDAYAHEHEADSGFHGKSEAWLILEASPDAGIIWGFKDALTPEEVKAAAQDERLEPHLNFVPVKSRGRGVQPRRNGSRYRRRDFLVRDSAGVGFDLPLVRLWSQRQLREASRPASGQSLGGRRPDPRRARPRHAQTSR